MFDPSQPSKKNKTNDDFRDDNNDERQNRKKELQNELKKIEQQEKQDSIQSKSEGVKKAIVDNVSDKSKAELATYSTMFTLASFFN